MNTAKQPQFRADNRPPTESSQPGAAGFTLLELLIAASLTAMLLLLVWSLFSIYTKLSDKGVEQAAKLQITRSLIRQMRADLRHVLLESPIPTIPQAVVPLVLPPNSTNAQSAAPLPQGPAFIGTRTRLQFVMQSTRELPPRRASRNLESSVPLPDVYDLVSYEWHPLDVLQAVTAEDQEFVDDRSATPSQSRSSANHSASPLDSLNSAAFPGEDVPDAGLIRRVTPWHQSNRSTGTVEDRDRIGSTDEQALPGETEPSILPEPDHAAEVARLQFRYFDGRMWQSQWNSEQRQRLPTAIEVSFDIEDPERRLEKARKSLDAESPNALGEEELTSQDAAPFPAANQGIEGPDGLGIQQRGDEPFLEFRFVIAVDTDAKPASSPGARTP